MEGAKEILIMRESNRINQNLELCTTRKNAKYTTTHEIIALRTITTYVVLYR